MPAGPVVAVIGGYDVGADVLAVAEEVGRRLAEAGAVVVTGGRRGVAEAASRGAALAGGTVVGVLPGRDRAEANPWVGVAVPTGMGETRNALVVMGADAVVALPGSFGTLSEMAFALLAGTPVVGIGTWELRPPGGGEDPVIRADDAEAAATLAVELARAAGGRSE
ncbi:MAG TPA: TIGR00725 family protein [Acidimicrobiales bacterium]